MFIKSSDQSVETIDGMIYPCICAVKVKRNVLDKKRIEGLDLEAVYRKLPPYDYRNGWKVVKIPYNQCQ